MACPMMAQAGEVVVSLPALKGDGVLSLHAVDQARTVQPLKHKIFLYQKNRMFSPHVITIPVGSTVEMTNDDVVYHNVFSFSKAKPFDLGLYSPGEHKEVLFDQAGEVKIFCAVHMQMYAVILVMDTPWVKAIQGQKIKAQAHVRFADIPAGRYKIHVWQNNHTIQHKEILTVASQGLVRVDFEQSEKSAP